MSYPPQRQLVVEVTCSNILRSIDFYRSLGFSLVRSEEHFAELTWDDCQLFLEEHSQYVPPQCPAANLRILVEDVDEIWEKCLAMGVPIVHPIENRYYGLRDFTILDLDGFGLRFATDLPRTPDT